MRYDVWAPIWSLYYNPYPLVPNRCHCQCAECRTENSDDLLDGLASAVKVVMRSFVQALAWLIYLSEKLVKHSVNSIWGWFNSPKPEPAQLEMVNYAGLQA